MLTSNFRTEILEILNKVCSKICYTVTYQWALSDPIVIYWKWAELKHFTPLCLLLRKKYKLGSRVSVVWGMCHVWGSLHEDEPPRTFGPGFADDSNSYQTSWSVSSTSPYLPVPCSSEQSLLSEAYHCVSVIKLLTNV